nr:RNA-binding protein 2-like [Ipomoea batatas]
MGDAYWNRQAPMHQPAGLVKRPRSDYDIAPPTMPVAPDMHNYFARDDDRGMTRIKDTQTIGSAYDRYLQSSHVSSFSSGETSNYKGVGVGAGVGLGRVGGGDVMPGLAARDPVATARGAVAPELVTNGRGMGYVGRLPVDAIARPRETLPLPPDASSTLYVEGLPPDSTKREVAHIFRPFVGYKEVRLVRKESKHVCQSSFSNPYSHPPFYSFVLEFSLPIVITNKTSFPAWWRSSCSLFLWIL